MNKGQRTVKECEERLEEIQDHLARLADILENKKAEKKNNSIALLEKPDEEPIPTAKIEEADAKMNRLKQKIKNLEVKLKNTGLQEEDVYEELGFILDETQNLIKTAGATLMLLGLGGAITLCSSLLGEIDIDEWLD
ncbi:hypothetical protein [Dethiosulfovibrio salsuginis]|uniref:Uncharacterized protein n=1 Tax=Dethiosulfovibrio salsuginis TaxID=561720 RepID=A0A1X7IM94_9BACT|nr:hypothetical protein [Dethiosulfovibrio salsuginis]SMG16026.1 hypothetical protein SAMN06275492_10386 [Dethiosulfovibrio salsuginis]